MDKSDSALLRCDKNQNTTCDPPDKPENNNMIPSKPSKLITALSSLLPSNFLNLPPRWQNWFVRGQSGLLLISAFCTLISLGPLGLFSLTLVVQVHSTYYILIFTSVLRADPTVVGERTIMSVSMDSGLVNTPEMVRWVESPP